MTEVEKILLGDIDIMATLAKLDFPEDQVEAAAMEQPKLFIAASTLRVQKMRARGKYESMLEIKRAALNIKIREEFKSEGEKPTEGQIAALILRNKKFRILARRLRQAEEEEEFAKLLVEAFRMRRDSLKVVGDHRNNEALTLRSGGIRSQMTEDLNAARRRMKSKYPGRSARGKQ